MPKRSIFPFGPQHPVLPEPIHLDLVLEDEKVIEAIPSIGYVHRGLESLVAKKDFNEMVYVTERICGICSFMHGMGYCMAVEQIMDVQVPRRAEYLRTIWAERPSWHLSPGRTAGPTWTTRALCSWKTTHLSLILKPFSRSATISTAISPP